MDTLEIEGKLREILAGLSDSKAIDALDQLLKSSTASLPLFRDRQCRSLLSQIEEKLRPESLKYELCRDIRVGLHQVMTNEELNRPGKSLHTLEGTFLWTKGKCSSLFQTSKEALLQANLFTLMSAASISRFYCRYGRHILDLSNMKSRTISYEVKGVLLVSKCTPVFYTDGQLPPRLGVFLQTRRSRRMLQSSFSPSRLQTLYPFLSPSFFIQSPATPHFPGVPKSQFSTPLDAFASPVLKQSGSPLEAEDYMGSLSPSLLYVSEQPEVREFSPQ